MELLNLKTQSFYLNKINNLENKWVKLINAVSPNFISSHTVSFSDFRFKDRF